MIRIYGVPTCDKIKKTQKLLENNNIAFTFVNVRKEPISKDKLRTITNLLNLENVLNRKGLLFRKLGLKDKSLSDSQLFEELFREQGMIKRPLIEKDGRFWIGYNEEDILKFLTK